MADNLPKVAQYMDSDPLGVVERTVATRLLEQLAEYGSTIVDCEATARRHMDAQDGHLRCTYFSYCIRQRDDIPS